MYGVNSPAAPSTLPPLSARDVDRNWRRFVLFRVLFNARFYYPILAVFFLDLGLSPTTYTLLNFAWALAIVCTDLPAGLLADRFGRRPLVIAAAVGMVLEMIFLVFAPYQGGLALVLCCLANRVISGMAEGMASGADEALVFDSLAEQGRSAEWPRVLDQVMRWQSVGMVIAMLVGGAVYDPIFVTHTLAFFGTTGQFVQADVLRFPIYLNVITALLALALAFGLREPGRAAPGDAPTGGALVAVERNALHLLRSAWGWIVQTPIALFVIVAGVLLDSVIRLFFTFSSSYFRIIDLPEASYGLIGAGIAGVGLFVSPVARGLVARFNVVQNYAILGGLTLLGLIGVALHWAHWGLVFILPLTAAMMALGYVVSYYLNAGVDSVHRATVLSFKGLAFNLGYGFISLIFALFLRASRAGGDPQAAVRHALYFLPLWIGLGGLLCLFFFWQKRRELTRRV